MTGNTLGVGDQKWMFALVRRIAKAQAWTEAHNAPNEALAHDVSCKEFTG